MGKIKLFLWEMEKKNTHTHTRTIPKHILKKKENPPRERDCVGNLD